ncbi:MAG: phage holin family protein [Magnetococcus sp. WYHC-3]
MKDWLSNLGLAVLAIFAPIKAVIFTVGALVFADLILGLACAIKNKEPITSRAIRSTVSKLLAYQIAIMLGFLVEKNLIEESVPITKILSGLIGIAEFKSILENADILAGGNLFKSIIEKLKG